MSRRAICTVSTVKDSLRNVEQFVHRNLAAGVDHMFVFLEGDDEGIVARLEGHAHVTAVLTDAGYWGGERPDGLNARQVVNANLVNALLAPFEWVDWLFHIDGDECLDIDRDRLRGLTAEIEYVQLVPREAVSRRRWAGDVTHFKELLGADELNLLTSLGVIAEPRNVTYFNGHIAGKAGIRPRPDLSLLVHQASRRGEPAVQAYRADFLHLLHYESYSGEEFVRKWSSHLEGGGTKFKPDKLRLRSAISALVRIDGMSEDRRRDYLFDLYTRNVEDDFETLLELGLLVERESERHSYVPRPFTDAQQRLVDKLLRHLLAAEKDGFRPGNDALSPAVILRGIGEQLGYVDRGLASRIDACLADLPDQGSA